MELLVGIDLGTTYSSIAFVDSDGRAEVVLNSEGRPITPSVIGFRDGEIVFGEEAKDMLALGTYPAAAFFKREMGDPYYIFEAYGAKYTPTDLSATLLTKLKNDAEKSLGQEITHAVITVPAYFKDPERKATILAGQRAGLKILQIINEPTAAAIAYCQKEFKPGNKLMVYDLGGGTFDVTLVEITHEGVKVLTSDGDHRLGGKDWDDKIVSFAIQKFKDQYGIDPSADISLLAELAIQAESSKKQLTQFDSTAISLTFQDKRGSYALSRDIFENITADLLERTTSLANRVMEDMKLAPDSLDGILLVGGSTRMPMVHNFVKKTFNKIPTTGINVDEAVAIGAAIYASQQGKELLGFKHALGGVIKTQDVTNHSLGMIAINGDRSAYINSIILPKNAAIPCGEMRPYIHRTIRERHNTLEIFLTQGESDKPNEISYLGRYVINDIPYERETVSIIEIRYNYNESGTVGITANVQGSPKELNINIEDLPDDVPARFTLPPALTKTIPHSNIYLAFDLSGSMDGIPLKESKKAALEFMKKIDLAHCSVGVIAFSDTVIPKLKLSQNAKLINKSIENLKERESGWDNVAQPFDELLKLFKQNFNNAILNSKNHKTLNESQNYAIVLTDGVWNFPVAAIEAAKKCHANDIDVIAIGFGGANRNFLKDIASKDEHSFFTDLSKLSETYSTIAQEITSSKGISTSPIF
ncbi:MAG: Hsp70 family protein [Deltaproteobacteria bacterium]|jgi:molecular chaperone DnaK (HSP70)/uncharacterized protein YegL|nr:Hsp70 family protein [Deltaproteobacteria bacterium]